MESLSLPVRDSNSLIQGNLKNDNNVEAELKLNETLNIIAAGEISKFDLDSIQTLLEDAAFAAFRLNNALVKLSFDACPSIFEKFINILETFDEDYVKCLVFRLLLVIGDSGSSLFISGLKEIDFPSFVASKLKNSGFSATRNLLGICTTAINTKELFDLSKGSPLIEIIFDYINAQRNLETFKERQLFSDAALVIDAYVSHCSQEECGEFLDSYVSLLSEFLESDNRVAIYLMLRIISKLAHFIAPKIIQETNFFECCLSLIATKYINDQGIAKLISLTLIELINGSSDFTKPGMFNNLSIPLLLDYLETNDITERTKQSILALISTIALKTTDDLFQAIVNREILDKYETLYNDVHAGGKSEILFFFWSTANRADQDTFIELYLPKLSAIMLDITESELNEDLMINSVLPLLKKILENIDADSLPLEEIKEALESIHESSNDPITAICDELLHLPVFNQE